MKPLQFTLPAMALMLTSCGGGPDPLAPQTCQERIGHYLALVEYENGAPVSYETTVMLEFAGDRFSFPDGLKLAFESNQTFRLSVTAIASDELFETAEIVAVGMGAPPIHGDFFTGEFRFFLEGEETPFLIMDASEEAAMDTRPETQEISKLAAIADRAVNMEMYIDGGATVVTSETLAPFAGWLFSSEPEDIRVEFYPNAPALGDELITRFAMPSPAVADIRAGLQSAIDASKLEYEKGKCFARTG